MKNLSRHAEGTGFFLPHGDLTSFSQKFHNFGSTGPNCKIFTFLEMASKFIGTSSWARGRGTKIEDATAIQRFPPCHLVILNTVISLIFQFHKENFSILRDF